MAIFDCDNHYYEALDAFTRHLAPEHRARCVHWAEVDGRRYHVVGGKLSPGGEEPDVRSDRARRGDVRLLPR